MLFRQAFNIRPHRAFPETQPVYVYKHEFELTLRGSAPKYVSRIVIRMADSLPVKSGGKFSEGPVEFFPVGLGKRTGIIELSVIAVFGDKITYVEKTEPVCCHICDRIGSLYTHFQKPFSVPVCTHSLVRPYKGINYGVYEYRASVPLQDPVEIPHLYE